MPDPFPEGSRVEQRQAIAEGAVELLLFSTGPWQVWLNHKQDFDGLMIGYGPTREEALTAATEILLEGVRALRALGAPRRPPDPSGAAAKNGGP